MKEVIIKGVQIEYNNENIKIKNSYKIKKKRDMMLILRLFQIETKYYSKRDLKSWIKEWKAHNRLYRLGLFRTHTRDCDLEENEKMHRLIAYKILGI